MSFITKLLDKFKLESTRQMESARQMESIDIEQSTLVISQYSDVPRYYIINGKEYDIDNPEDIRKLPLFRDIITVNDKEYGMDSILRKHSYQSYIRNKDIYNAAQEKLEEYSSRNIYFETEDEKIRKQEYEENQRKRKQEELKRIKLHDSFKIEDMYQFTDIPFEWQWIVELNHTKGIAWFMLNMNNQYVALQYINQINELIIDAHSYIEGIKEFEICTEEIDFMYPIPMYKDSIANTYVECVPYTKTGKISKYPVILHFASSELVTLSTGYKYQNHPYIGEIKIMQDGNIGMANISFGHTRFSIRLLGLNLVIKRIDSDNGNLFKYEDFALDY